MVDSITPSFQHSSPSSKAESSLWVRRLASFALICSFVVCLACGGGGGGGGGGTNNPGEVVLTVERGHIDSGDIANVRVEVFDINEAGVVLKLKFTKALKYIKGSAYFYKGEDKQREVTPNFDSSDSNARYLVFFFSRRSAYGRSHISLDLNLKAVSGDPDGYVEVDLDNNDPTVPDLNEFSTKNPGFTAQERSAVEIDGTVSSGGGTPTPTPTAAAK